MLFETGLLGIGKYFGKAEFVPFIRMTENSGLTTLLSDSPKGILCYARSRT